MQLREEIHTARIMNASWKAPEFQKSDRDCARNLLIINWSQWWGLNPRPTVYETVALPLSYIGMNDSCPSGS